MKNMDIDEECCICLDNLKEIDLEKGCNRIIKTKCNHKFHSYCIRHHTILSCPICRAELKFKSYYIVKIILLKQKHKKLIL